MIRILKIVIVVFVFASILQACRSKGPYNPYLKMKTKPSEIQIKEDKKIIKKGNRKYERQMGNNRRRLFGMRKAPGVIR